MHVSPRARVRAAWVVLIVCVVCWPATMLTVARDEPPFVLSLSWVALIFTALNIVATADVRENDENGDDDGDG